MRMLRPRSTDLRTGIDFLPAGARGGRGEVTKPVSSHGEEEMERRAGSPSHRWEEG